MADVTFIARADSTVRAPSTREKIAALIGID